jgi:DNA-binding winged helix-turn-helix (wHTH) protein
LRLTGKPLETLIYLARNHGRVVTREVLLDAIWSGVYVTPNTLEHAIGEIRHVLADVKEKPQFIQTVSGIGYCFTSEVEEFPGPRELAGTRV